MMAMASPTPRVTDRRRPQLDRARGGGGGVGGVGGGGGGGGVTAATIMLRKPVERIHGFGFLWMSDSFKTVEIAR